MLNKKLVLLLAFMLIAGVAWASPEKKQIINTVLDDSPTSITGTWNTDDYKKIGFFVDYNETEIGGGVSIAITVDISHDGTNWLDASFYDFAGGSTLQTSETMIDDGYYFCWLDNVMQIPYVRLSIVATNTDTNDLADVDGYLVGIR